MSQDDDLRAAERALNKERVTEIRQRMGDGPVKLLAAEFRIEIAKLEQENGEIQRKAEANRARIEFLRTVCAAILPAPCKPCQGHGRFREWVAQDESHLVA